MGHKLLGYVCPSCFMVLHPHTTHHGQSTPPPHAVHRFHPSISAGRNPFQHLPPFSTRRRIDKTKRGKRSLSQAQLVRTQGCGQNMARAPHGRSHRNDFTATESDPCIFTHGTNILILYVDDCVILSKNKQDADKIFNDLTQRGYKLMDEGSLEEYLGISIKRTNKTFTISQPHLIDRIIASVPGMETPAAQNYPPPSEPY